MAALFLPVTIVVERRALANRWQTEQWEAVEVQPAARADSVHAVCIMDEPQCARWLWAGFELELVRSEAEDYYLNISAAEPRVFVMWRFENDRAEPKITTVSYGEAARMMDAGEQVDGVLMPHVIYDWIAPFVAEHYKPEPRKKVRRNDPFDQERNS